MPSTPKSLPKISVQIWRPLLAKFDTKVEAACLRRDAFLNRVLQVELEYLDAEVCLPNSAASQAYVSAKLEPLDRKVVSLALHPDVIARLNEICLRKRIVRDAFFNRLFFLLAADPKVIDTLLFGDADWRADLWIELKNDADNFQSGFYPLESVIAPFWAIRAGLEMYAEREALTEYVEPSSGKVIQVKNGLGDVVTPPDSVYTILFDKKLRGLDLDLLGLNCYVPDWMVPGQTAQQSYQAKLDELLNELM